MCVCVCGVWCVCVGEGGGVKRPTEYWLRANWPVVVYLKSYKDIGCSISDRFSHIGIGAYRFPVCSCVVGRVTKVQSLQTYQVLSTCMQNVALMLVELRPCGTRGSQIRSPNGFAM